MSIEWLCSNNLCPTPDRPLTPDELEANVLAFRDRKGGVSNLPVCDVCLELFQPAPAPTTEGRPQ